jgi:glycerophosphoryl diester phosphodiesterase
MTSRRTFLSSTLSVPAAVLAARIGASAASDKYKLIAHRGGLVDDGHAENSPGSVKGAIDRGYWMLEVDIRRTKDGEPVLQHDANFKRYYGDPRAVEELTWEQISRLRATPGNTSPIHFRDLCKLCSGKTRLMLDIKSETFPDAFYANLRDTLAENRLLDSTYLLGGASPAKRVFGKSAFRSCTKKTLRDALDKGEDVKTQMYLFELASDIDEDSVKLCREAGVTAVAAINTFRYTMAKRDEWKGAEEDATRMKQIGITYFQIDSLYEPLFA